MNAHMDRLLQILFSWTAPIFRAIIPSFIPRYGSSKIVELDRRLSPTAYLDGVRGIACFVVFWAHFAVNWFPRLRNTYGASPEDRNLLQLPLVRVVYSGEAAVATFFVISGYALSYRALSKINNGTKAEVLDTLSSAIFRRCARIYLPCVANTIICAILQYYGCFTKDPLGWNNLPPRLPTLSSQFWDWWKHMQLFMYPFRYVDINPTYSPPYNGHLWTIPYEIRGSFVVYGTVLATAKLTNFWRMAVLIVWISYFFYNGKWDLFLFVSGVFLAALDVPRHLASRHFVPLVSDETNGEEGADTAVEAADTSLLIDETQMEKMPLQDSTAGNIWASILSCAHDRRNLGFIKAIRKIIHSMAPWTLFLLALYLLSYPHVPYGGQFLLWCVPRRFEELSMFFGKSDQGVRIVGAVLLCYAVAISPTDIAPTSSLRNATGVISRLHPRHWKPSSLFTNAFAQYLGRISFGFYLMHGPILFTIGTRMLVPAWKQWEEDHDNHLYVWRFLVAAVVNLACVFWAGDIFARIVDEKSVMWVAKVAKFMSRDT